MSYCRCWCGLLLCLLLIGGCATVKTAPTVAKEPPPETATEPPASVAPSAEAPVLPPRDRELEKELKQILEGESRPPEVQERELPVEVIPEPAPVPPSPMEKQSPMSAADPDRLNAALSGEGAGGKRKAALALLREGRKLAAEGNDYLAESRFERALSVDPQCGQAYLALAELRFAQQKWDQAANLGSKAVRRLQGESYFLSRAHLLIAKSFVNTGRTSTAYNYARDAVAADPSNQEALRLLRELDARLGTPSREKDQ